MTPRWLYRLMIGATGALMVMHVLDAIDVANRMDELRSVIPMSYGSRAMLRPYVLMAVTAFLWWRFFRHERAGARPIALAAALALFGMWVIALIVGDMTYRSFGLRHTLGYPLVALAYIAYTIGATERSD